jgi:osmotically-inducible protein OsmY
MADKNQGNQQNGGPYGYRHRYGGGYYEDHSRGGRSNTGGAYSNNEEEGYTQDIGRQHSNMQGNRNHIITGNRGSEYAQAMGNVGNRATGRGGTEGPHRGKGPRNYERSQDRIREDVCERLTDDAMLDATHVEVRVENNEVVLSGTVHNREEKRRAEDLAEAVAGVRNVENRLRVEPTSGSDTNSYREYDEQGRIKRGS